MSYINTETGQYPISEAEIRAAYPNTSFGVPFTAPDEYVWVFPTPQPAYDAITQSVCGIDPILTDKGHYEQRWSVTALSAEIIAANILAAKTKLKEAATAKRWSVMTGGLALPSGIKVGTDIDDQNRITSVVANVSLVGLTDTSLLDFKAVSGWVSITVAEVKAIAGAIGKHVQNCYAAERVHHEAIDLLETVEQVSAYDVNTGWPV